MVIAHNPKAVSPYHLKDDDGSTPTTWNLRALLEGEMVEMLDNVETYGAARQASLAVKMGLVGVEHFLDDDGKAVALERPNGGLVPQSFMDRLNWQWVLELAREVCRLSGLIGDDVEKSEPLPTD